MADLIHVIYNSAATRKFTNQELATLLSRARNRNAGSNITGMLLYLDGTFFQVLEGPAQAVDLIAEVIQRDSRHANMTTIIREPIVQRSFGEWTMGFVNIEDGAALDTADVEGLNDFFRNGQVLAGLDAGRAKKLLQAFKQGRWRARLAASMATPVEPAPRNKVVVPTPSFGFAFQAIINTTERRVVGHEALVRGEHQEPAAHVLQMVPLSELGAFDEDARRVAIGAATRLGLSGQLHLNFLPQARQFNPLTIQSTLDTAERASLKASDIVLEIKQEAVLGDPLDLAAWLRDFRSTGMKISIDDFGSGYAGLALLDHYQPEMISLSMWVVRGIEGHGPRQAIVRGLVQTCGDLGIDIIAKGVETAEEYHWLRDEGVELFQGFLFSKPAYDVVPRVLMPAEESA